MSGSVNKVILVGHLGADPEVRRMTNGNPVVNLRVATSESWRDKNSGERKEKTEWHQVVIFSEGICKVAEQYLKKGSKVYLEGQLQTRKWQDSSGADKYTTEIVLQGFNASLVMLDGPQSTENKPQRQERAPSYGDQSGGGFGGGGRDLDDEIPFAPEWRV